MMKRMLVPCASLLLCACGEEDEHAPIPTAEPIPGKAGYIYSPYTGKELDVRGKRPGLAIIDVSDELAKKLIVPWVTPEIGVNMPYAVPVPGWRGYVFNPFTGNPVDVRDVPAETVVTDPNDRNSAHRFKIAPE